MSDLTPPVPPAGGEPSQPPYGQPGYAPYGYAPRTNTLAIVAFVLGLCGFVSGITAIGGIICGHLALSQINRTGEGGRGFALAGLIIGYALIAIGIVVAIVYVVILIAIIGTAVGTGYANR